MQFFPIGKVYDFMRVRVPCGMVSLLLVLGSFVLIGFPGPNLGTDFKGGTELELAFLKPITDVEIRETVGDLGFSEPEVIRVNDDDHPHRFLIRLQEVSTIGLEQRASIERALCFGEGHDCAEGERASDIDISPGGEKVTVRYRAPPDLDRVKQRMQQVSGIALRDEVGNPSLQNPRENKVEILLKSKGDQVLDGLRQKLGPETVPAAALRVEWVGPKAGAQLRDAALKSIAVALVLITIYIAFRFDMRFAPGAMVAVIHDAVGTIGVLILMQRELTLSTVAAILTIVGYSVNDTVVVYDRVRENFGKLRGSSFVHIINVSMSEMLGRTILTNLTALISLLAFLYWGTGTLKEFALTLIIGIALGTYSSIYVALPLTHWLDRVVFNRIGQATAPAGEAHGQRAAGARKDRASAVL